MGKRGLHPRSITAAPRGSVRAHFRTAFTPTPVERPLPRRAKNSTETSSYPFDRSIMDTVSRWFAPCTRSLGVTSRLHSLTSAYLKNWPNVLGWSKSPRTDVHSEFNGNGLAPSRRRRESPVVRNVPGRLLSGNLVLSVEHSRITDAALRIDD